MRHHKKFTLFTVTLALHICTRPNLHSQLAGDGCEFFMSNEKQGGSPMTPRTFDVTLFTDANG